MRGFGMLLVSPEATMREAAMAHATAVLPNTRARLYSFFMPVYNPVIARSCETVVKPLQKCTEMAFASNPVATARPEAWLSFARAHLDTATGARLWRSPAAAARETWSGVGPKRPWVRTCCGWASPQPRSVNALVSIEYRDAPLLLRRLISGLTTGRSRSTEEPWSPFDQLSEETMNAPLTRREFLADVGRGMLVATVGCAAATELGLAPAFAADAPDTLDFGSLEPLVRFMQETPPDKLLA